MPTINEMLHAIVRMGHKHLLNFVVSDPELQLEAVAVIRYFIYLLSLLHLLSTMEEFWCRNLKQKEIWLTFGFFKVFFKEY